MSRINNAKSPFYFLKLFALWSVGQVNIVTSLAWGLRVSLLLTNALVTFTFFLCTSDVY